MKTFSEQLSALEAKAVAKLTKVVIKHNKKVGNKYNTDRVFLPDHLCFNVEHGWVEGMEIINGEFSFVSNYGHSYSLTIEQILEIADHY
jgi:hypothetical protein